MQFTRVAHDGTNAVLLEIDGRRIWISGLDKNGSSYGIHHYTKWEEGVDTEPQLIPDCCP